MVIINICEYTEVGTSEYTEDSLDKGKRGKIIYWIDFQLAMKQLKKIQTDTANFQIIKQKLKDKMWSGATAVFPFQTQIEEFCNDQFTGPWNGPLINTSSSKIKCPVTWLSDCV